MRMANFDDRILRLRFATRVMIGVENMMARFSLWVGVVMTALSIAGGAIAGGGGEPPDNGKLSPQEAGARYGQALGAGRLCKGYKVLAGAEELAATFKGDELKIFKESAAHVVQAWQRTTNCPDVPNVCMRSHLASCYEAMREIGPEGNRYPGLIGSSR